MGDEFDDAAPKRGADVAGRLAALIARAGISPEDVDRINRVNAWQGMIKKPVPCERCHSTGKVPDDLADDGQEVTCPECAGAKRTFEPEVVDMVGVQLSPAWEAGPQWPVVQPAKPCVVRHPSTPKRVENLGRVTVLLPDPQIGYRRLDTGELVPMQDERAIATALDVTCAAKPVRVVWLGDTLDFAEWSSKFLVLPEFVLTTQPTVDRGHRFLADTLAAAGPQCEEADLLEGNHDNRLPNAIARNAMAAMRLRQANAPQSWPVLSLPHLLRLDELGINYVAGYPAGRVKLADAHGTQAPLYALHGERIDVTKQAKAERISTVQGHAHHVAVHTVTYDGGSGQPVDVEAWSLGCLCRRDGAVPSTKGGTDVRGRPVERVESWQHAVGVLTETDDGWWLEPVVIRDGLAMWRGKTFGTREAA